MEWQKLYFEGPMRDVHRHCYLGDALCRIDYWASRKGGCFGLHDLRGPDVGNPFGLSIHGVQIPCGAEYHHHCAHQILDQLGARPAVVGELGGGYGGMAYYLLRDGRRLTYIGFDVEESIALTSYYLLKSFPSAKFLLYGEKDLTPEALKAADVVLLPTFEMPSMPPQTLDLMFSSHVMGDLSDGAMSEYVNVIARTTRDFLLYFGDTQGAERIYKMGFSILLNCRETAWNHHKAPKAKEGEYLYRLVRASTLAC